MFKKSFHFLWIGQACANSGDVFYIIGIISLIYQLTGSAFYTALLPFTITLARFFGSFVAPWVLDRMLLKHVLVGSQGVKTLLLMITTFLFISDYITATTVIFIFPLVSFIAFLDGWAVPARQALIVKILDRKQLLKGNSFLSVVDQTINLGCWPLGAIITSLVGGQGLLLVTGILFSISTFLMLFIMDNKRNSSSSTQSKSGSFLDGWRMIWSSPSIRTIAMIDVLESLASVVWIAAILYIYVEEILQKPEAWWGYINSTFFAGLLVGGFITLKCQRLFATHVHKTMLISSILISLLTILFGFTSIGSVALILSAAVGMFSQFKLILSTTIYQTVATEHVLAKVFSARDAILTGSFAVGTLLFGIMADFFHVTLLFIISAAFIFVSSIIILLSKRFLSIHNLMGK
ncbi:MFS family permease [Metabacillus crassostreae]|uniref:MFS transporter n=1 Tax=Metabacillus crassostreae TaxID=929098 RepID=UPI00195AA5CC|nr:MFS transporter [Metabacillus crassostreae]MBM7604517.1 MFS family permease [Metabacillus crassostreae]